MADYSFNFIDDILAVVPRSEKEFRADLRIMMEIYQFNSGLIFSSNFGMFLHESLDWVNNPDQQEILWKKKVMEIWTSQ